MPIYRGVGGVNREIKKQFRGVSGANREIKEQWRGVSGVNRKVFSSSANITITQENNVSYDLDISPLTFTTGLTGIVIFVSNVSLPVNSSNTVVLEYGLSSNATPTLSFYADCGSGGTLTGGGFSVNQPVNKTVQTFSSVPPSGSGGTGTRPVYFKFQISCNNTMYSTILTIYSLTYNGIQII